MSVSFHIINPHQPKQLILLIEQQIARIKQSEGKIAINDIKLLQAQLLKLQRLINPASIKQLNQASFFHLKQTKIYANDFNASIQLNIKICLQLLNEMKAIKLPLDDLNDDLSTIAKQLTLLTNNHFSNSTKVNSNPDYNLI